MLNKYPKRKQKTIINDISIKGIGLHTGVETVATFKPAKENFGIRFKRLDIDDCPEIIADILFALLKSLTNFHVKIYKI